MVNLLSKNKLLQKTLKLPAEIKVTCPNLYKLPGDTPLLVSSIRSMKIHTLDFAKFFETLKEQMKCDGNHNFA